MRMCDARPKRLKGIQRQYDMGLVCELCDMSNGDRMVAAEMACAIQTPMLSINKLFIFTI